MPAAQPNLNDQLADLGRDAAREAWAEHGGDLDAVPHSPELRAWARAGHAFGVLESDRPLSEAERRALTHGYRGEPHRLAAESDASARAADDAAATSRAAMILRASRKNSEITQVFGSMHASSANCPSGTSPRGPSDGDRPDDPRFTVGLFAEVACVLDRHGYRRHPDPRSTADALVALLGLVRAYEGGAR